MKRRYHSRNSSVHLQMEHPPSFSSHPGDFVIRNLGPFFERSRLEIRDFALRLEKFPLSFSLARTFLLFVAAVAVISQRYTSLVGSFAPLRKIHSRFVEEQRKRRRSRRRDTRSRLANHVIRSLPGTGDVPWFRGVHVRGKRERWIRPCRRDEANGQKGRSEETAVRSRERVQPTINNERAESVARECCLRVPFSRCHRPRPALLSSVSISTFLSRFLRVHASPAFCSLSLFLPFLLLRSCPRFVFVIERRPVQPASSPILGRYYAESSRRSSSS